MQIFDLFLKVAECIVQGCKKFVVRGVVAIIRHF